MTSFEVCAFRRFGDAEHIRSNRADLVIGQTTRWRHRNKVSPRPRDPRANQLQDLLIACGLKINVAFSVEGWPEKCAAAVPPVASRASSAVLKNNASLLDHLASNTGGKSSQRNHPLATRGRAFADPVSWIHPIIASLSPGLVLRSRLAKVRCLVCL
jgi:hypothetical protein